MSSRSSTQLDRSLDASRFNELKNSTSSKKKRVSMIRRMMEAAIVLLLAGVTIGQVKLKLPDTTAVPGSSLLLPIITEGFRNVGSFSLTITFDKNVLTYNGAANQPKHGFFNATPAATANRNGAVALSWFNVTPPLNIRNGKLVDLRFTYKNGTSPLTFAKMVPSSVTDSLANNLSATVKNGKISARNTQPGAQGVKRPSGVK